MQNYRNWGLMIFGIYLSPVVWASLLLAVFLGASTYFFSPVYEAKTVLSLDNDLSRALKGLKTPIPEPDASEFIRIEYFATNTLEEITYPEISAEVVNQLNITDNDGAKISPDDLHTDSPWLLSILPSQKKGVAVEWVADTQQFSVTGYAPDLAGAVELSNAYANAFLDHNKKQFSDLFDSLLRRLQNSKVQRETELAVVNEGINKLQHEYAAYDLDNSKEKIAQDVLALEREVEELKYAKRIYKIQFEHATSKLKELEGLKTFEKKVQKNPEVTALLANIRSLLIEQSQIAVTKTAQHPAYKMVEEQLQAAQQLLDKETETILYEVAEQLPATAYSTLFTDLVSLVGNNLINDLKREHNEKLITSYREKLDQLNDVGQKIMNLTKQLDNIYVVQAATLTDIYMVKSVRDSHLSKLRIVSSTNPEVVAEDSQLIFPKRKIIVVIMFIATFFVVIFYVFFSEIITDKLYVGWQLTSREASHLAEVPFCPSLGGFKGNTAELSRQIYDICVAARPHEIVRVGCLYPRAGHEAIAMAIASYIRRFDDKVVIFDCDTTSGLLTKHFGLAKERGLKNILRGDATPEEVLHTWAEPELKVIPVGTGSLERCGQEEMLRFENLLTGLKAENYKIVIVDAPSSQDELLLTEAYGDARCLLVLKSGSSAIEQIEDMRGSGNSQWELKSRTDDIVLTARPYIADILSLGGIANFLIHFVTVPYRLFKSSPN